MAGPTIVSAGLIPDPSKLHIRGLHNGKVVQDCGIEYVLHFTNDPLWTNRPPSDLIFSIPKLIAHLSQGTTLKAGTVIITGTPAGVGVFMKPKLTLKAGDEFTVEILPHIGSLINKFENE